MAKSGLEDGPEQGGYASKELKEKVEKEGIPVSPEEAPRTRKNPALGPRYETEELEKKVSKEGIPLSSEWGVPKTKSEEEKPEESYWKRYLLRLEDCRKKRTAYPELVKTVNEGKGLFYNLDEVKRMHISAHLFALAGEYSGGGQGLTASKKIYQQAISYFELGFFSSVSEENQRCLKEIIDVAGKRISLAERLLLHAEVICGGIERELANPRKSNPSRLEKFKKQLGNINKNIRWYAEQKVTGSEGEILNETGKKIERIEQELKPGLGKLVV